MVSMVSNELSTEHLDKISDPFITIDDQFQITYINQAVTKVFKRPESMIAGSKIWELDQSLSTDLKSISLEAYSNQKECTADLYAASVHKWFEVHFYPFVKGLSIIFLDITDRIKDFEEQEIVKARLKKAEEIGNLGYWELSSGKNTMWGSEKTLQIFGLSTEESEVPIEKVESLITDLHKLKEANYYLIKENKKYKIQLHIQPADGSAQKIVNVIAELEQDKTGTRKIVGVVKDISEWIKAEENLLQSYKQTASILESIDMAFFLLDSDWKVKSSNTAAISAFASANDQFNDKTIWEIIPASSGNLKSELISSMTARKSTRFEDYFPVGNLWMRINAFPVSNGLALFLLDITEKKRQENIDLLERDALDFYTNKNATLVELITFLLNGLKKIHPEMLCSVLKYKNGHLYNWASPHLPDSYNKEVEGLEIGVGKGSCGSAAYLHHKVIVPDIRNNIFWKDYQDIMKKYPMLSCSSYPIIDSHQNLLGTFGIYLNSPRALTFAEEASIEEIRKILVNVIEKKLVEEEAKEYKDQLELIFNTSREIIFLIKVEEGSRFKMARVNNPYLAATGLEKTDVEGKYIDEIISEPLLGYVKEKYKEAILSGKTISWEHISNKNKGEIQSADVYITPIMNHEKECMELIGYIHDTSHQKRAEEEIKKTNEELRKANTDLLSKNTKLEEIAWMQSHKVRAPVARILGLADLIINYTTDKYEKETLVHHMIDAAKELDEMITEIVKLSSPSS